ncbi:MAG: hypothetical protein FWF01_00710, partial [Alphaproteobacteria bacterium]|nr:hypothetical protein [Alphaproteobacteria bacterium]
MKETLKSLKGGCIWFFELVFRKLLFVSWYIVLLWLSVDYCINNWEKVTSFTPFSGHSLIFVYMLALSIMPFVKKIGFRDV